MSPGISQLSYVEGLTPADVHHIALSLRDKVLSVDQIIPDPNNARKHDSKNIKAIADSLKRFGQRKPIVVDQITGYTQAGAGTLTAAKLLGWKYVAAVLVQDDARTAMAYALADNRTAELASWDYEVVAGQVQALHEKGADSQNMLPGWDQEEIAPLLKMAFAPAEKSDENFSKDDLKARPLKDFTVPQRSLFEKVYVHIKAAKPNLTEGQVLAVICEHYMASTRPAPAPEPTPASETVAEEVLEDPFDGIAPPENENAETPAS